MEDATLISVYDAAQLLGCSCQTVRRLIRNGVLQSASLPGGRKLWLTREQVTLAKGKMLLAMKEQRQQDKKRRETLLQMWLDL